MAQASQQERLLADASHIRIVSRKSGMSTLFFPLCYNTSKLPKSCLKAGVANPNDLRKKNSRTTAQQVANQFLAASGKQIFRKTVARRLKGGRLYARRPVVCVPLTRQQRTARLQWCREHHNWTEQDWACVLFSDESRFSLSSDCRPQLIWRESGTAYRPENIRKRTDIRHAVSWCGPAS
ncbi:retrovirus-related Pol polyprotein from transposon 297 [Trichonephila clavipes]|nr:retrovirus-related Pol polyprotein from transposon 297 [Trichonephila clavipes]